MTTVGFQFQDYVVIDGVKSPGVAVITGASLTRSWDKRKGYGTTGATLVYTGEDLAEFTIEFQFWDWLGGQRDEWVTFAKDVLVKPPTGKFPRYPKAQQIKHWQLNDPPISISAVVVKKVGQPEQDETGLVTVKVDFSQYRAPKAAIGQVTVPAPKKAPPTAQDEADRQIQALTQQFLTEAAK